VTSAISGPHNSLSPLPPDSDTVQDSFHDVLRPSDPSSADLDEIQHLDQVAIESIHILPVIGIRFETGCFDTVWGSGRDQIPFAIILLADMHLRANHQGATQYPCVCHKTCSRIHDILDLAHCASSKYESRPGCHNGGIDKIWAQKVDTYPLQATRAS
jgi:hypothetical protein